MCVIINTDTYSRGSIVKIKLTVLVASIFMPKKTLRDCYSSVGTILGQINWTI